MSCYQVVGVVAHTKTSVVIFASGALFFLLLTWIDAAEASSVLGDAFPVDINLGIVKRISMIVR